MPFSAITNGVKNSPITRRDAMLMKEMLGPSKHETQVKTNRSKPDAVDVTSKKIDVPRYIMKFYKDVELAEDVMHVKDVPFLTTITSHMNYGTVEALKTLKYASLEFELKNLVK